jgi:hypothetical protein
MYQLASSSGASHKRCAIAGARLQNHSSVCAHPWCCRYATATIKDVPYKAVMTMNFDNGAVWSHGWDGVFKGVAVSQ